MTPSYKFLIKSEFIVSIKNKKKKLILKTFYKDDMLKKEFAVFEKHISYGPKINHKILGEKQNEVM